MFSLTSFDPRSASPADVIAAQKQLRTVECYNGGLDGAWGDHCRAGLLTYKKLLATRGEIVFFVHRSPILQFVFSNGKTREWWIGPAEVDGDGPNGNPENDPCWQPTTSLRHNGRYVDSRVLRGMVVAPQVRRKPEAVVLGCQGWITNIETEQHTDVIVYDTGGPADDGEVSFAASKLVGIPSSPINGGTSRPIMQFEFEAGTAGVQDGVTYTLQPA